MSIYYNNLINPRGSNDIMCKLKNHNWKNFFVDDREFRFCKRCDREERKEYLGLGMYMWAVNEVKAEVA
jgi:hypothetical protein